MDKEDEEIPLKPPTTFEQQITLLEERNLTIPNRQNAVDILKRVNYYRFSAYTLSLKKDDRFFDGVTFYDVWNLYEFDRKLRSLLLSMLEIIEISTRTDVAYFLARKYGPVMYEDKSLFWNDKYHDEFLDKLRNDISKSSEPFIVHHRNKYSGRVPLWAAVEIISFGTLSKFYSNLNSGDQNKIARINYSVPASYIRSWLSSLAYVRNVCAHFGRFYNKKLTTPPKLFENEKKLGIQEDRIFAPIYIMRRLCKDEKEWDSFVTALQALIEQYDKVNKQLIGFPENWYELLRGR